MMPKTCPDLLTWEVIPISNVVYAAGKNLDLDGIVQPLSQEFWEATVPLTFL